MKTIFMALLVTTSLPAFADYFGCHLKVVGSTTVTNQAEYGGRSTEVSLDGFICKGTMDAEGNVTTSLTDTNYYGTESSTAPYYSEVEILDWPQCEVSRLLATCSCGLE